MAAPKIDVINFTRSIIGKVTGYDEAFVNFSSDQDLLEWEARAGGSGRGQGLLVGEQRSPVEEGYALKLKNPWDTWFTASNYNWDQLGTKTTWNDRSYGTASFIVENEELTQGDKTYRINIYGKNEEGAWNGYGG